MTGRNDKTLHPGRHPSVRGMVAAVAACTALLGLTGCERWRLDRQMEELCKKDGGVKVYETVKLPASEFNDLGTPLYRYYKPGVAVEDQLGPQYRFVLKTEILVGPHANAEKGEGQLRRLQASIHRRSDGMLLGEQVWYDRSGGDWVTFGFQPSGKSCPQFTRGLAQTIFVKGE